MNANEKISLFKNIDLNVISDPAIYYEVLEKCGDLKNNYHEYMTTEPINCDEELTRLHTADYDFCCALLTMLLREDHFNNGAFCKRQKNGDVKRIVERITHMLTVKNSSKTFSEKSLAELNGYYVYALIDPETNEIFYIGKGNGNRIFSHEIETDKILKSEKEKHLRIQKILSQGLQVKKLIINWGLTESEAFAAEASLINTINYVSKGKLTNIVSGHHVHEALTTEDFELIHGAEELKPEDIKHSILVIKINKMYRRDMNEEELYNAVRGFWNCSLNSIKSRKVEYVFGVYNGLIVAVYKPDEWHYTREMIDIPQKDILTSDDLEKLKNRVYFICNNYKEKNETEKFYLYKSINNSSQNPITYLSPHSNK